MNCPFCGIGHNDSIIQGFTVVAYFFACGNAYDNIEHYWIDNCSNQPRMIE